MRDLCPIVSSSGQEPEGKAGFRRLGRDQAQRGREPTPRCAVNCWVSLRSTQPPMRRRLSSSERVARSEGGVPGGFPLLSHGAILLEVSGVMHGVVVPRGRSKVGQRSCRPPPIRAGFASPVTPFRVRHDQRELDRRGHPIYENGAGLRRPAQVGCGRLHPRDGLRHARSHSASLLFLASFFCSTARSILPSRPRIVHRAARRPGQGGARSGPPQGVALTRSSTARGSDRRARRHPHATLALRVAPSGIRPCSR